MRLIVFLLSLLPGIMLATGAVRDPTRPSSVVYKGNSTEFSGLSLTYIATQGAKGREAEIDGKMLHVGDWVRGYRVMEIDVDHVTLSKLGGVTQTLYMGSISG